MPVYEYTCLECNREFSRFFWRIADATGCICRCGSTKLEQLISHVNMVRSEESRRENLADPNRWGDPNQDDPKSMARMVKKMSVEMGEDLGSEFNEVMDRLEAGEDPKSIDQAMEEASISNSSHDKTTDSENLF